MAQAFDFVGGPCAGKRVIDGEPPAVQTFARNPGPGQPPKVEVAAYRLDQSAAMPQYHFAGIGRPGKFHNGPLDGHDQLFIGALPTTFEAHNPGPTGKIIAVARYALKGMDATGAAIYELVETVDLQTDEDRALSAIYQFYKQPDPSIYSIKPGLHKEIWIEVGNRRASVDEEIAELIKAVWGRGWETIGSCQERPSESKFAGMGYISFPLAAHGKAFAAALERAEIEHKTKEKTFGIARRADDGQKTDKEKFPSLHVFFYKRDVDRIISTLNSERQQDGT